MLASAYISDVLHDALIVVNNFALAFEHQNLGALEPLNIIPGIVAIAAILFPCLGLCMLYEAWLLKNNLKPRP